MVIVLSITLLPAACCVLPAEYGNHSIRSDEDVPHRVPLHGRYAACVRHKCVRLGVLNTVCDSTAKRKQGTNSQHHEFHGNCG